MKVKVISRLPPKQYTIQRNLNPELHPMAAAREVRRIVVAAKLERIYAKPFVCALSGHMDGIWSLCRSPRRLNTIMSGSCDGGLFPFSIFIYLFIVFIFIILALFYMK